MNPEFFGDSYDIVKRFFCGALRELGYQIEARPLFTGDWAGGETAFLQFIGARTAAEVNRDHPLRALFMDPDTGLSARPSDRHITFSDIAAAAAEYELVFAFDQSFSRGAEPIPAIEAKRSQLRGFGLHSLYYDSHARFVFAASSREVVTTVGTHLMTLGLPSCRLIGVHDS